MDKKPKTKKFYVTKLILKTANSRVVLTTNSHKDSAFRSSVSGKFVSRDELKEAFKTASRKLKSA